MTNQAPDRVIPTWEDPVARSASTIIGGPLGRHVALGRALWWTPLRVVLAFTVLTLCLAWLKQAPCSDGNWTGSKQYTHFCYSDSIPLWGVHELNTGAVPYADAAVEYPAMTGGFMYVAAEIARTYDGAAAASALLPQLPPVQTYYLVTVLLLSLSMLVVTWSTALLARRRIWDAAMVALSPLLFVHAFTNWDLFAMALAGAGLLAWSRQHPVLAGVLLGLGAAAKFYPFLFLGPLFLLCLRSGRLRPWLVTAAATIGAWAAVNLPLALLYRENWSLFFSLNTTRPADPDTIWNIAIQVAGGRILGNGLPEGQAPGGLNVLTLLAFLGVCVLIAVLALTASRRPRLPQLLFLVVAGFLLTNKVWSPQFSLWLLPLAVLARPEWRMLIIWQVTEAVLWVPRLLWYLGTENNGIDVEWFLFAVTVRDVAVLVLAGLVVRDVRAPERDVVRRGGVDDPAGGVLDGAPDRVVFRRGSAPGRHARAEEPPREEALAEPST